MGSGGCDVNAKKLSIGDICRTAVTHYRKSVITSIALAGFAAAATTAMDNIHFGSTVLNSPAENHYVWGIAPKTEVRGNGSGDVYTFGLYARNSIDGAILDGDLRGFGLMVENALNDSAVGRLLACGLFMGVNDVEGNTFNGEVSARGLLAGISRDDGSTFNDGLSGYGLLVGGAMLGRGFESFKVNPEPSVVSGDFRGRGTLVFDPDGKAFGSSTYIGLDEYLVPGRGN